MSTLMGWNAPTFLNTATAAIEVRAQMLLKLLLLLQSLRYAFHPCVCPRLALGNEKARLRRLFILSVQLKRSDKPDRIKQIQTPDIIQMPQTPNRPFTGKGHSKSTTPEKRESKRKKDSQ